MYSNEPQREKTYLQTFARNEDSNQTAHPRNLIRVFVVRMMKLCILVPCEASYQNVQADLNLFGVHMSEGTFCSVAFKCKFIFQQGFINMFVFQNPAIIFYRFFRIFNLDIFFFSFNITKVYRE